MSRIPGAKWYPADTSNYWKGRGGYTIKYFTVHHTAGFEETLRFLYQNPARDGSATFFAGDNHYEQYLDTKDTPWTNGNSRSNRESLTCETRGLWQNGYKDGTTLKQLEEVMYQCLKLYPNLKLTYHKDVSNKPTACPADLKDKGYAEDCWNRAKARIAAEAPIKKGVDEMLTNENHMKAMWRQFLGRDPNSSEKKAYLGKRTYAYTLDKLYRARKDLRSFIAANEAQKKQIAELQKSINALSARPTSSEYAIAISNAKEAADKLTETQKQLEIAQNKTVEPVDEQEVVTNWFKRIVNSIVSTLFKKKEK